MEMTETSSFRREPLLYGTAGPSPSAPFATAIPIVVAEPVPALPAAHGKRSKFHTTRIMNVWCR